MTPAAFRELRRSLGLTQEQLAEHLGRTRRAIWCYETGRTEIPKAIALAMAGMRPGDAAPRPLSATAWLVEGATAHASSRGLVRWFPLARADTRQEAVAYKRKLQAGALKENLGYVYRVRGTRLTANGE